ncbi:hypothetical protein FIBSPDRAFT_1042336 [Athelia psychrophila]|uniref:Uncharacterized protein n=1 Tax=Athelia psychrophila TaxID=1759441 RepID=A0A166MTD3_9AGAM|nr:hypothetical protein FIBSPDRAFT_1042336 [Fibularhizoctonia sp. CBS 109695]
MPPGPLAYITAPASTAGGGSSHGTARRASMFAITLPIPIFAPISPIVAIPRDVIGDRIRKGRAPRNGGRVRRAGRGGGEAAQREGYRCCACVSRPAVSLVGMACCVPESDSKAYVRENASTLYAPLGREEPRY